jgi:cytochrome c556
MRIGMFAAAAAVAATATGVALAALPNSRALAIMHERHEGMERIGKTFKALHRELDAPSPNLNTIRSSARTIRALSVKASHWFTRGTGPEIGKTGAKPEIWQNPQDFVVKMRDFQAEARAFDAAARSNDLDLIRAQSSDLGQTCKACHDKYRSEMHH